MTTFNVAAPAAEGPNPYLPTGVAPLVMEEFAGLDTNSNRTGVDDKQCYWIDGFFPLGHRKARTLPGVGTPITFSGAGGGVVFYEFANIGATPYCIVIHADGSIRAVNTTTYDVTTLAASGTILAPTVLNVGISQWADTYVIIVANQPDGYFVWDGTNFFSAGGVGPVVTLTNPGSGYVSVPSVTASGGSGTGATFAASIANGVVTSVAVTNPGSGWKANETINLVFTGGQSAGTGADLTANMSNISGSGASLTANITQIGTTGLFLVSSVTVNSGGSNYTPFTTITAMASPYGDPALLSPVITGGVITSVTVSHGGTYFDLPVTLTVNDTGAYYVSSVNIVSGGSGYSDTAAAVVSGGTTPTPGATLSLTITGGVITAVTVTNGGDYADATAPTISVTDTLVTAAATATLMPFGIQGTDVEIYSGYVWVAKGATLLNSAPGSVVDFTTGNGGGSQLISDSTLKNRLVKLLQTNGFLYLIGDSSVSYVSGVQTTGTGPSTTTYSRQNADPEIGSPWPSSVLTFSRTIMFANAFGVQVSYGAAVTKVSEPLDGVYNTVANFGDLIPSAAKANIFGKKVWMLLLQIVDPVSNATVNKLLIWTGKAWFASEQDVTLVFIAAQEIDSVLTTWGTDGTSIYPLFDTPSTAFAKTIQSKLWTNPIGYQERKATTRLYGLAQYDSVSSPSFIINIDNEQNAYPYSFNNQYTITPSSLGGVVPFGPIAVGQQGLMLGHTWKTNAADATLISGMIQPQAVGMQG